MQGTEKQIKWAKKIKEEFIEEHNEMIEYDDYEDVDEANKLLEEVLKSFTHAAQWIDFGYTLSDILDDEYAKKEYEELKNHKF